MATTLNAEALQVATDLMSAMATMKSLGAQIQDVVDRYNKLGIASVWAAMTTGPMAANGTISGASDTTPNPLHPILEGSLNRSETDLLSGITACEQFQNFLGNEAVTQGDYLATVLKLAG